MQIKIKFDSFELKCELEDNDTGREIYKVLPLNAPVNVWGEEIYFKIPVHVKIDSSAKSVVNNGDLGFWPSGDCFCIFFGKQPVSKVNIFGKIIDDLGKLKEVRENEIVTVTKISVK